MAGDTFNQWDFVKRPSFPSRIRFPKLGNLCAYWLGLYHAMPYTTVLASRRWRFRFFVKRFLLGWIHMNLLLPLTFIWEHSLTIDNKEYPLGELAFDFNGVRLGVEICEDGWLANRPGRRYSLNGVDLIANLSASHFAFGKHETRRRFVADSSRSLGVTYLYANLLGNEAGRIIYDGGCLIASAENTR